MRDGDPYRSPPTAAQFVCVVCYRSLSVHPGECKSCGVDRLPLGDPEVRAEVRAEAEKRLQNRHYGEWFWSYLLASLVMTPVTFVVHGVLQAGVVWLAATLALGSANVKLYERLNPRSILRLYADRRQRLGLSPATAQKLLPARADDPEDADLPHVLALLGARVDSSE